MKRSISLPVRRRLLFTALAALAFAPAARAQQAAGTTPMTVVKYIGQTARVQDPIGSPWRSVDTKDLPKPAPVERFSDGEWVEIRYQGRPVRINIINVEIEGIQVKDPVGCRPGQPKQMVIGMQGFGGCTR